MKVATEHMGIKYSLQPHGLKSKLFFLFASFVVAFGGALAIAAPASADPTDSPGTCYVAVPDPVQPSPAPTPPLTSPSPTPCPTTPPPVTTTTTVTAPAVTTTVTVTAPPVTITKKVTVYVDQTTTQTETVTITPPATTDPPAATATPTPSKTSDPLPMKPTSVDSGSLVGWGLGTVGVLGAVLATMGLIGVVRGRRHDTGDQDIGRHHVDNSATTLIPVVRSSRDDHDVSDYGHGDYDSALGGYAGETMQMPAVEPDSLGDADTKPHPSVQ